MTLTLTGEVGGIKRTENTRWPAELAKFGLEGFKAYDTEHGFTTVVLPTGYGVIVRVRGGPEHGIYEKCTPGLLAYCMFSEAAKRMQKQSEPVLCLDGGYRLDGWIDIRDMHSEQRRLTLEKCFTDSNHRESWKRLGEIDPIWVAEHINQRPELLDGFKF